MLNKLLVIIRNNPQGLTLRELMIKCDSRAIATDLAKLLADGKIQRIGDKFYAKK